MSDQRTKSTFRAWLLAAAPGASYIYHTGNLAEDREVGPGDTQPCGYADALNELATDVWDAAEAGLVTLSQRRVREGDYALSIFTYIATRTGEMA